MNFGERLKQLRMGHKMTQESLGKLLNVGKSSISSYEKNTREPNKETIVKIAQIFDVSTDYLLGKTDKRHYYDLTDKDKKDVGLEVEEVLNGMTGGINFYGEPMTDEGREKLKASLEMALELSKREAKKKFTPKKYRDG